MQNFNIIATSLCSSQTPKVGFLTPRPICLNIVLILVVTITWKCICTVNLLYNDSVCHPNRLKLN